MAKGIGEYQPRRAGVVAEEVSGERLSNNLRHGDRPKAGLGLGRAELGDARSRCDELAVHSDLLAAKVDPVDGETEALALAHAHAGAEDDEAPVTVRYGGGQRFDLCHIQRDNLSIS